MPCHFMSTFNKLNYKNYSGRHIKIESITVIVPNLVFTSDCRNFSFNEYISFLVVGSQSKYEPQSFPPLS